MLINHVKERGTGKTTEIIERMNKESNVRVMVLNSHQKQLFPKELREKIITINDYDITRSFNEICRTNGILLIDEGYVLDPAKSAQLFYMIGSYGVDVEVYGTFK